MNRWNQKFRALEEWKIRALQRAKAKGIVLKFGPIEKPKKVKKGKRQIVFTLFSDAPIKEAKDGKAFDNPYIFQDKLEKKGFKPLGSGCFSTVLAKKGSDKVIKITRIPDGWIDYCHWAAKEGFAGKFAPKVYSYKRFNNKVPFEVSIVERMDKTFWDIPPKEDVYVVRSLANLAERGNNKAATILEELAPELPKFITKLQEKYGKHSDMHDGNIMVRKDGTICYTDPVAIRDYQYSFTRLRSNDFIQ